MDGSPYSHSVQMLGPALPAHTPPASAPSAARGTCVGSAQEGDKRPHRTSTPLGPEHRGIVAPEILVLVQGPHASHQMVALAHEDGCSAACAAACR